MGCPARADLNYPFFFTFANGKLPAIPWRF